MSTKPDRMFWGCPENIVKNTAPLQLQSRRETDLAPLPPAKKRVLLVDDLALARETLRFFLELLGVDVVEAENGREAVELAAGGRVDLILMDVRMPVMDGLEAARAIRAAEHGLVIGPADGQAAGAVSTASPPQRVPIIALSASTDPEEVQAILAAGMDELLRKPVNQEQLRGLLARHLGMDQSKQAETSDPGETAQAGPIKSRRKQQPQTAAFFGPPAQDDQHIGPDMDWERIEEDYAGNLGIWRKLVLRLLDEDLPRILEQVEQLAGKREYAGIPALAHRIKGGGLTFGLSALAGQCRLLEEAVTAGDESEILRLIRHELPRTCQEVRRAVLDFRGM